MRDIAKCPTCGKPCKATSANKWRPFCCHRCKMLDLGDWISERHTIPGESAAAGAENKSDQD